MKKLAAKCILFLLVLASVLYLGGALYRHSAPYAYLEYTEDSYKFRDIPNEIHTAAFGSSHGRDAFPLHLGDEYFFNFAMTSQTPCYDEMQMRQFAQQIKDDALIVLTVSYYVPYMEETEEDFLRKQNRYYRFMDPENILEVNRTKWLLQRFSPLLTTDFDQLAQSVFEEISPEDMDDSVAGLHQTSPEDMPSEIQRITRNHIGMIGRDYPAVEESIWLAYRHMLDMCQENGWKAVLVTPPYLREYVECYESYSEGYSERFHQTVAELAAEYDVAFLDYSQDAAFADTYEYFKNIDHLNYLGAEAFWQRFFADVEALDIDVP